MGALRQSRWAGLAGLGLTALLLTAVPILAGGREGGDRQSPKGVQEEIERLRERLRELEGRLKKAKGDDKGQRPDTKKGERGEAKKGEAKKGERPADKADDGRAAAFREMREYIDRKLAELERKGDRPATRDGFGGFGKGGFGKGGFGGPFGRGGFGMGFEKKDEKRQEPAARGSDVEQRLDRLMRELEEIRRELRRK
jgi:hypothetical protein